MKRKLKSSTRWDDISLTMDVILLIKEIKYISFKFEDQKYQLLAIHNSKTNFYIFRQNDLSNSSYLVKFNNQEEIASSLGGNLHDEAVVDMVFKTRYSNTSVT